MAGGWTTNLRDTDLLFVKIASYCYDGGPSNCPIYHKDGPAVISGNMQQTLLSLRENPLPVLDVQGKGPMIATYDDFKVYMREVVYNPLTYFPETTQILYDLSQGNGSSLAVTKLQSRAKLDVPVPEQCEKDGPYSPSCFTPEDHGHTGGATSGIACSDAAPSRLGQTKEEYRKYAKKIAAQSHLIGESWSSIQMPCTAWEARPHWRYDGRLPLNVDRTTLTDRKAISTTRRHIPSSLQATLSIPSLRCLTLS